MTDRGVTMDIRGAQRRAYETAASHGFWDDVDGHPPTQKICEKLCLIHSEVSEALEALREEKLATVLRGDGKPEGFPSELADIVIRTMDLCEALGIDLEDEMELKMSHNEGRPRKHGKAF